MPSEQLPLPDPAPPNLVALFGPLHLPKLLQDPDLAGPLVRHAHQHPLRPTAPPRIHPQNRQRTRDRRVLGTTHSDEVGLGR